MRVPRLKELLLPLLLLAFVASAISFLQPVLNVTTRWALLAFVAVYLVVKGHWTAPLRTAFGALSLIAALWALATCGWSEVPSLSYLKVAALAVMSLTGLAIGQHWVRQRPAHDCLMYLFPLTVCTLVAGAWGNVTGSGVIESGQAVLYQGAVSGPNMFGAMVAMCFPFLVWQSYRFRQHSRKRMLWAAATALALYYVFASGSRAALLVVICTTMGLVLSLRMGPRLRFGAIILALAAGGIVFFPAAVDQFMNRVLYKQETAEKGMFHTREDPWQESYEAAVQGGWFGAGYGVSIGDASFESAVSSFGYGREKGNSQLAIVEETGLTGLAIYLVMLVPLFFRTGQTWLRLPHGPDKALVGVVIGTLAGMVVHSGFEAWWTAPASPESAYFWTLAGVALALRAKQPKRAVRIDRDLADAARARPQ